jgi:hypothetical protein
MKRTKRYIKSTDLECKGSGRSRKARRLPKGAPNVCYRVRSKDSGDGKRHFSEVFSGKTGQSLGFIGSGCTIVPSTDLAVSSDHLNRMNTEDLLRNCVGVGWTGKDHVKPFKKAIKEAEKKQGPKK